MDNLTPNIFFLSILAFCFGLSSCKNDVEPIQQNPSVTIAYSESSEVIFNPERGFLRGFGVFSEGTPINILSIESLKRGHRSLAQRIYYLEKFKNSPLSEAQLNLIRTDMNTFRLAGIKCVLRFAYTDNGDDGTDAPIDVVEGHLDQLAPIFSENADIIAFVNAGFIGLWGEWHSSTNNLSSLENKKRIVNKLLTVLPKEIKIQLRTPKYKRDIFGENNALTDEIGYSTDDIARVGHHNDCFMASTTDYGTYQNPVLDKEYISQEAYYVPTGGETCPPSGIEAADCETARSTMSQLKWTYLNLDWYKPVLDGWRMEGCFEEFEMSMGYRFVLKTVTCDTIISKVKPMPIKMEMVNVGWAPVYNYKDVSLILVPESGEAAIEIDINFDIRKLRPNEMTILEREIDISGIGIGTYALHLKIADQFESIKDRPEYCIQLANKDVWDITTGWNNLKQKINITE